MNISESEYRITKFKSNLGKSCESSKPGEWQNPLADFNTRRYGVAIVKNIPQISYVGESSKLKYFIRYFGLSLRHDANARIHR